MKMDVEQNYYCAQQEDLLKIIIDRKYKTMQT
jgi:hypothetical protein